MMNIKTDNIDANTVMLLGAVIGVIFIAWKAKGAVTGLTDSITGFYDSVKNSVSNIDLNPFNNDRLGNVDQAALYQSAAKSLAAIGKNIDHYTLYADVNGGVLPAGSYKVMFQGKAYYYVPSLLYRTDIFTAPSVYNSDAGAGSYG